MSLRGASASRIMGKAFKYAREDKMKEETEVKFQVTSLDYARHELELLGAKREWSGVEKNIYFDTRKNSLKRKGVVLRLRTWPGHSHTLTLKVAPPKKHKKYKVRKEFQIELDERETAQALLKHLGYVPRWSYEKYREHWKLGNAAIELDRLGKRCFIEIEATKKRIKELARALGLPWASATTKSYFEIVSKR